MRIAIAAMMHETNTFTTKLTPLEDFRPVEGEAVYSSDYWMKEMPIGGIVQVLRKEGVEILPIYFAGALPSGVVTSSAYQVIKEKIVSGIKAEAANLDGVCLALHGSMFVQDVTDPEGDLLSALRQQLPADLPIACALDMHGNITEAMVTNANILVGYRTAPHIDVVQTGARAAELLLLSLREQRPFITRRAYVPLLISGEQSETDERPMNELLPLLDEMEKTPGLVSASLFAGFPWADSPHCGVNVVVVGDKDRAAALDQQAKWLADRVWEQRDNFNFTTESWPLPEAIEQALADPGQPIIISDAGDNPTAGAAQDLAIVVKALVERGVKDALVVGVVDPACVEQCFAAGEGELVHLNLGRSAYREDADPYPLEAEVVTHRALDSNRFAVVTKDGVMVVIAARRFGVTDPCLLGELGLKPEDFKIIVVKSGYISPEYQRLAARKMFALTEGDTNLVLTELKYEQVPRPIYPLDEM